MPLVLIQEPEDEGKRIQGRHRWPSTFGEAGSRDHDDPSSFPMDSGFRPLSTVLVFECRLSTSCSKVLKVLILRTGT
jgi:hypothetical protein